jgi:hypothetical protein
MLLIHKLTEVVEVQAKWYKAKSIHNHQDSYQPSVTLNPSKAYAKKEEEVEVKSPISA